MTVIQSLASFVLAAGLLVVTPGLDTALILRTATSDGASQAMKAVLGIVVGCLVWGAATAVGLAALLAASEAAFTAVKWIGTAYLLWLGIGLIRRPRRSFEGLPGSRLRMGDHRLGWFWKGVLQNVLNPKMGIFYISFLPQFVPAGLPPAGYTFLLAAIHGMLGLMWFAALILATRPLVHALRRPVVLATLDRLTGCVFVAFGVNLALSRRP